MGQVVLKGGETPQQLPLCAAVIPLLPPTVGRVAEHSIGSIDGLKALFSGGIPLVKVRVPAPGLLPKSTLEFRSRCPRLKPQHSPVIRLSSPLLRTHHGY